jgi:DNA-binding MarR family transcriptional regulator/ribosomal protein S18 acetylase RimI-like enzyme
MPDHLASLGSIGFTYRLRRLADRIADAGRRLYLALGVPLEPNWHALLLYLDTHGPDSVTGAAEALRVSHPTVIEMARRMEAAGLVVTRPDAGDGRRRVLALSPEGRRRMPEFKQLWEVIGGELDEIIEATTGSDALAGLGTIEAQLDGHELDARVLRHLSDHADRTRSHARATPACLIRPVAARDRAAVLHIGRELVRSADTYAFDPGIGDEELWRYWAPVAPGRGYVAELDGSIAGIFVIRPNIPGPGAHVANASYAVRADVRGLGLGRRMGETSLQLAAQLGFAAMQFNAVVSTNGRAVHLWRSLGFRIVGTVPDGFRLPDGRTVSHHVMYRALP